MKLFISTIFILIIGLTPAFAEQIILSEGIEYEIAEITEERKYRLSHISKVQGFTTTGEIFFIFTSEKTNFEKVMFLDREGQWAKAELRDIIPDPKYNSRLVAKFINVLMYEGKKTVAENIVYGAMEILDEKSQENNALKVFNKAIDNVRPKLEVKSRRVGGATYQVPIEVPMNRGNSLAIRWIRDYARKKKGRSMMIKLADELITAYKGEGAAVKKRDDTHKMAEANKAFAHLRW